MTYYSIQYLDRYAEHQDHWFPGTYSAVEADDVAAAAVKAMQDKPGVPVHSITQTWWDKKTFDAVRNPKAPEPRKLKTPPTDSKGKVILWQNSNGRVVCLAHAGAALTAAVKASPRARQHDTDVEPYWRVSASDRLVSELVCEDCEGDRLFNERLAREAS